MPSLIRLAYLIKMRGYESGLREEAWDSFGTHYLLTPRGSPVYSKMM